MLEPGQLVTFNCAGSRGKTLALVLDVDEGIPMRNMFGELRPCIPGWVEVQWIQVAKWMPRRVDSRSSTAPVPGEIVKHPLCSAFEVIDESR